MGKKVKNGGFAIKSICIFTSREKFVLFLIWMNNYCKTFQASMLSQTSLKEWKKHCKKAVIKQNVREK